MYNLKNAAVLSKLSTLDPRALEYYINARLTEGETLSPLLIREWLGSSFVRRSSSFVDIVFYIDDLAWASLTKGGTWVLLPLASSDLQWLRNRGKLDLVLKNA